MRVTGRILGTGGMAVLASLALTACGSGSGHDGFTDGVPLAELDLTGSAPTGVALGTADNVIVTTGPAFTVRVEGPALATERLRFERDGTSLEIGRDREADGNGPKATVRVTLPAVHTLALGGSGDLTSDTLTGEAELALAGSGNLTVRRVAASELQVALAGSGGITAAGTAESLDLAILGSGSADMAGLRVGGAEVAVGGSGSAAFASDGKVEAAIAGSGNVRVRGTATCEVKRAGSGNLTCTP